MLFRSVVALSVLAPSIGRNVAIGIAVVLGAVGFYLYSQYWANEALKQVYVIHLLFSLALSTSGSMTVIYLVSSWFVKHRGLAIGIALVGTSMGTISAANAAARQKEGIYAGVVLTSSVTGTSRNEPVSIGFIDLGAIRQPVLIVYHPEDRCVVSRPSGVPGLVKDLSHAASVKTLEITGGKPAEDPDCEPLAPHGFYGKEQETVEAIAAWIKGTLK